MCGRYSLVASQEDLEELFLVVVHPGVELRPRYNVAPSQGVPIVRLGTDGKRELVTAHWGLIPPWAESRRTGYSMINARKETLTHKRTFGEPFQKRRCLVPATAFYEWQATGAKVKQPHCIRMKEGAPFAFAGIWERWTSPEGEVVDSVSIITTEPNELVAGIHSRMPVILPPESHAMWLSADTKLDTLTSMLQPLPASSMETYAVSTHVNRPANDDARCLEPLERQDAEAMLAKARERAGVQS